MLQDQLMNDFVQFFSLLFGIYWACLLIGFRVVRSQTNIGKRLEKFAWNSRIKMWRRQPVFEYLFSAIEKKKYLKSSFLVMLFNLPMVIFQFLGGLILLSPIIAGYAGVLVGLIIGQGRGKVFFMYTLATLLFELGAFAFAGAIGMMIGKSWLLSDISFLDSFGFVFRQLSLYMFLPFVCLMLNGFLEALGPFFGIDGVPGIKAYRNHIYK